MPPLPGQAGRFQVLSRLGQGGMGVVHLARDRERGELVALKTLRGADPDTLYRFKREFRALVDMSHPHVAKVHELIASGGTWHLVMEYVDGQELLTYLCGASGAAARDMPTVPLDDCVPGSHAPHPGCCDEARLRRVFAQLATALVALHDAGKVHKDLKPANVLVTRDERVVVVDFGMVAEGGKSDRRRTLDDRAFGTPAYMAPEQATGEPVTAAADWYAFGVVLHEALSGRLPFDGVLLDVILAKQSAPPPPLDANALGASQALVDLCMGLLCPDPELRFGRAEVAACLGFPAGAVPVAPHDWPLFGREREHAVLLDHAAGVRAGRSGCVGLYGTRGMGKTLLAARFCRELEQRGASQVLRGVCYEHEAVPRKAVDTLVDSLGRHLKGLAPDELEPLLPAGTFALASLFPVLRKLAPIERAWRLGLAQLCAVDVASVALRALRDLLSRMAARAPLTVWIDDMQWCDPESRHFLAGLVADPDMPAWLLVYAWDGPRAADPLPAPIGGNLANARLGLGELAAGPMLQLGRWLAGRGSSRGMAPAMVRLAAGSPARLLALSARPGPDLPPPARVRAPAQPLSLNQGGVLGRPVLAP